MLCTTTMRNAGSFSTFQPATDPGLSTMSFGVPNEPSADAAVSAVTTKRGRDDGGGSSSPLSQPPLQAAGASYAVTPLQQQQQQQQMSSPPPPPPQPPSSTGSGSSVSSKRSRTSTYQAPREVRPSILTAMGSLVGGVQSGSNTFVPQRRRLSGGFLDEFLGGHDNMDTDMADSRPRSMSF